MTGHPTLRGRLLAGQLALVATVAVSGLVAVRFLTPVLFERGIQARGGVLEEASEPQLQAGRGARGFAVSTGIQEAYDSALTRSAIVAGIAGLVAAALLALVLGRRLLRPLSDVQGAARQLAAGNYRQTVLEPPERELADLAASMNALGATLAATEEARARLMSDVAHEIRSPLTTIEGYMEGLIDGVLPPTAETYTEVANEAHRLSLMTQELSFVSKAQEGAVPYDTEPVDLADLAGHVAEQLRPRCEAAGIDLRSELQEQLPVLADPGRITQALTNLLNNAIAHTPAGGRISVTGRWQASSCEILVSDTGDGIPPDRLEVIFERFVRFRAGAGIGIGLNIARSIVQGHQGRLTAQSAGPGQGATFVLSLPKRTS